MTHDTRLDGERTMRLMALSHTIATSGENGSAIANNAAMWVATAGTAAAVAYLRGLWYCGVTVSKDGREPYITYLNFVEVVRATGTTWDDFIKMP